MNISNVQLQGIDEVTKMLKAARQSSDMQYVMDVVQSSVDALQALTNQVRNAPPAMIAQGGFGHSSPAPKPEPKQKKKR